MNAHSVGDMFYLKWCNLHVVIVERDKLHGHVWKCYIIERNRMVKYTSDELDIFEELGAKLTNETISA